MNPAALLRAVCCALFAIAAACLPAQQPAAPPKKADFVSVTEAKASPDGTMVYVRGKVLSFAGPRPESQQPYSIYVADQSDSIRVVIFQDVWGAIADPAFIAKGSQVDIYGESNEYQGTRQIVVLKPTHIRRTPGTSTAADLATNRRSEGAVATVSIGGINAWSIGSRVRVRGTVANYEASTNPRLPHRVLLKDASGEIEVIYWPAVADKLAASDKPEQNMPLQAIGEVTEFRGKLQIRVDEPEGISRQLKAPAAGAAQTSQLVPKAASRKGSPFRRR